MIDNYLCLHCDKAPVCKIIDIIKKFDDQEKKPLGIDLRIEKCLHYISDTAENGDDEREV